jgi:hypothetical protein
MVLQLSIPVMPAVANVKFDATFNGPPGMANGGYTAGTLAAFFDGPVEVTLRRPVPLERPLDIIESGQAVSLHDGAAEIATARPALIDIAAPPPPELWAAERASAGYRGFTEHPFPACFVCGPDRRHDGLRIFPGRVQHTDVYAAPWTPDASRALYDGTVAREYVWAALDCPGGIAIGGEGPFRPIVLGRITGHVLQPVRAGETYITVGRATAHDGRKHDAVTAIYTADGDLVAVSKQRWLDI